MLRQKSQTNIWCIEHLIFGVAGHSINTLIFNDCSCCYLFFYFTRNNFSYDVLMLNTCNNCNYVLGVASEILGLIWTTWGLNWVESLPCQLLRRSRQHLLLGSMFPEPLHRPTYQSTLTLTCSTTTFLGHQTAYLYQHKAWYNLSHKLFNLLNSRVCNPLHNPLRLRSCNCLGNKACQLRLQPLVLTTVRVCVILSAKVFKNFKML